MERLNQRLESALKTLSTFGDVLAMEFNTVVRDAAIKRFEYTLEITWKLAQTYLREKESIDLVSPRRVIRACFDMSFLNEDETKQFLDMINDRNLTTHTYDEETAQAIYDNLNAYYKLLDLLINKVRENASS